jgi:hypothetical protein
VGGDEGGQPWEPLGGQTPRRFTQCGSWCPGWQRSSSGSGGHCRLTIPGIGSQGSALTARSTLHPTRRSSLNSLPGDGLTTGGELQSSPEYLPAAPVQKQSSFDTALANRVAPRVITRAWPMPRLLPSPAPRQFRPVDPTSGGGGRERSRQAPAVSEAQTGPARSRRLEVVGRSVPAAYGTSKPTGWALSNP